MPYMVSGMIVLQRVETDQQSSSFVLLSAGSTKSLMEPYSTLRPSKTLTTFASRASGHSSGHLGPRSSGHLSSPKLAKSSTTRSARQPMAGSTVHRAPSSTRFEANHHSRRLPHPSDSSPSRNSQGHPQTPYPCPLPLPPAFRNPIPTPLPKSPISSLAYWSSFTYMTSIPPSPLRPFRKSSSGSRRSSSTVSSVVKSISAARKPSRSG